MKKHKENSHEGITWSEMEKQNVQAKEVYSRTKKSNKSHVFFLNYHFFFFFHTKSYKPKQCLNTNRLMQIKGEIWFCMWFVFRLEDVFAKGNTFSAFWKVVNHVIFNSQVQTTVNYIRHLWQTNGKERISKIKIPSVLLKWIHYLRIAFW